MMLDLYGPLPTFHWRAVGAWLVFVVLILAYVALVACGAGGRRR